MIYHFTKAAQKLRIKGGDCNKLYFPELKAIYFLFFYNDATGRKSTIVKKSDLIKYHPEALEATNKDELAQYIKDNNIGVNMEVAMSVVEIDEDDTKVGEEESL